jgi:hypothetical protein
MWKMVVVLLLTALALLAARLAYHAPVETRVGAAISSEAPVHSFTAPLMYAGVRG